MKATVAIGVIQSNEHDLLGGVVVVVEPLLHTVARRGGAVIAVQIGAILEEARGSCGCGSVTMGGVIVSWDCWYTPRATAGAVTGTLRQRITRSTTHRLVTRAEAGWRSRMAPASSPVPTVRVLVTASGELLLVALEPGMQAIPAGELLTTTS